MEVQKQGSCTQYYTGLLNSSDLEFAIQQIFLRMHESNNPSAFKLFTVAILQFQLGSRYFSVHFRSGIYRRFCM